MERIDQQERIKKAIPAHCDPQVRTGPEPEVGHATDHWLSSAMAIWLRDDDVPPLHAVRQDTRPAPRPAR